MSRIITDHDRIGLTQRFLALHLWDAAYHPRHSSIVSVWERRRGGGGRDECWIDWEGTVLESPEADGGDWDGEYAFVPLTRAEWGAAYMTALHTHDTDRWAQQALRLVGLTRADLVDQWHQTVGLSNTY